MWRRLPVRALQPERMSGKKVKAVGNADRGSQHAVGAMGVAREQRIYCPS
jgi:hypothetical protein